MLLIACFVVSAAEFSLTEGHAKCCLLPFAVDLTDGEGELGLMTLSFCVSDASGFSWQWSSMSIFHLCT